MGKISMLTSVHSPFDVRIFHKEGRSLKMAGHNVTIIARYHKDEIVEGIKIVALLEPKSRVERMTKTVWQLYRKALEIDADIYHFHDPELIPVGLLLKRHGKCVIYDVHEDLPRQNLAKAYIPALFRKPISTMVESLEDFSVRRFDGVVTATPYINRRFLRLSGNAIKVSNYPLVSEMRRAEGEWERKGNAVCYVGGIADIRGAVEMVEAVGMIGCRLLLAGNFAPSIEDKLRQMIGWRQVEVLGYVDREGVMATMARSMAGLVLLHPIINYLDALPIKMFEYMSAGIPVIASNFPFWKKLIEETGCGLCCDPLNPEEIARAIQWVLDHPEEAQRMGERGRKAVMQKYNWESEEKKLVELYRNLMA